MLNNLKSLQEYLLGSRGNTINNVAKRACSFVSLKMDKKSLKDVENFPVSYIDVVKNYNTHQVEIAGFSISPHPFGTKKLSEALLKSAKEPFFPCEFMKRHELYQIGTYNTDLICVTTGTERFKNGEVLIIEEGPDIYNPEDSQIHPIAKDFEHFLIIIGNLDKLQREVGKNNFNKQKFIQCLENLEVDKKYHDAWLSLFG